jgi:hypothetical protein
MGPPQIITKVYDLFNRSHGLRGNAVLNALRSDWPQSGRVGIPTGTVA